MFKSIDEIKRAAESAGSQWFSPASMRYFGSRISNEVINGKYFVTTETDIYGGDRRASIRVASPNGSIDTVGEFREYNTIDQAKRAARKLPA